MGSLQSHHRLAAFGLFEADLTSGELYRRGRLVPLQEKPYRILAMLLERPGDVVTRDEMRKQLWPDGTFVDFDEGLDTAMKKLRYALGDSAQNPTFIETIPRRGYRFIAPVSDGTFAAASLTTADVPLVGISTGRTHWRKYVLGLVASALLFVAALGIYRWKSHAREFHLHHLQTTKLTDSGRVSNVAVSPDGRYLVYARHQGLEGQDESLWLREIATGGDIQLLPPGTGFHGLTFSPSGSSIYLVRSDEKDPFFKYLYVIPTLGDPRGN